ncbi:hypothetical protein ACQFX9_00420 [Aliinostoc sp. HNIBRCY26]|uniref:hypothetical protein n=1 Tax=Aliinostoc sp. HNIBRCY26 TaxID=3418997 RepID=UPI003D001110
MTTSLYNLKVDILNHTSNLDTNNNEVIPTLSYKAIKKSILLLQSWVNHLPPLYGVSEADIADIMPLLLFIEATIYQIDENNEIHEDITKHSSVLRNVLNQLKLLDDAVETLIQQGLTYYDLETQFCLGKIPTPDDIDSVCLGKSFDYGLLSRLFFKLTGQPDHQQEILQVSRLAEQIIEIRSDLKSYNEDIERNVMNIYRMFVRLYSSEAPQKLQIYLENLHSQLQGKLKLLEQNRPDMAEKFISIWNNIFPEDRPLPEIPQPILEEGNLVGRVTTAYTN